MPKIKKTSTEELVFEDNKWQFKKVTTTYEFDQFIDKFGRFVKKGEPVVTYSTIEEHGLAKTQRMTILIKRHAVSPQTLKALSAMFIQVLEARIPDIPEFKDWFLSVTKPIIKKDGKTKEDKLVLPAHFLIQKLDETSCQTVSFHDPIVKKVGKETRVSAKEAVRMLKEGMIGAILEEDIQGELNRMRI